MNEAPIGYYVHHHGEGHRRRAMAIAAEAPGRFTLIGTGVSDLVGPFETLELADDRALDDHAFSGRDRVDTRPAALHYAPYGHDGIRSRMQTIATWIADKRPALMVVDVSVEVALLARLCATPTLFVRLAGSRNDPAHLDAFRGSRAVLAPFDQRMEDDSVLEWVRRKTSYVAGIGSWGPAASSQDDVVLAAFGRGGTRAEMKHFVEAAEAVPSTRWRVIGPFARADHGPDNLQVLGWVDDPASEIAAAGVVVGAAGDGLLGGVAAAARPYICIPEHRPYGEQAAKARRLEVLQAAVVCGEWPSAAAWPDVLQRARALDTRRIAGLHDPSGPAAAAAVIMEHARA